MPHRVFSAFVRLVRRPGPSAPEQAPALPEGLRVYAVGDIHGERRLLERLLERIAEDIAAAPASEARPLLVFLGDYVDRGHDSRGTLERLCSRPLPGADCRFLAGNHEQAMLDFLEKPEANAAWLRFGGTETLASYGIRASAGGGVAHLRSLRDRLAERLPETHRRFLAALEPSLVLGGYLFVHAGIRPGRRLDRQKLDDLLWIREPFLSSTRQHERVVVHGHTVVDRPELLPNRIGIDTGAYATGVLTALVLEGDRRGILQVGTNTDETATVSAA